MWMNTDKIVAFVSLAIYILIGVGIYFLFEEYIKREIARLKMYSRLRRPRKENAGFVRKIDDFVFAAIGKAGRGKNLIAISLVLAIASSLAIWRYINLGSAFFTGLMFGALPYIILRMRLEKIRGKGSKEGESIVAEMLGKYRICKGNIDKTLEMIVQEENRGGVCRQLMGRVLSRMREAATPLALKECGRSFAYSVNANWADMLSYNIGVAASEGVDISPALEDILVQLREARTIFEERRRMNSETSRVVLFMVPISYIITLFFSVNYLGIGMGELIKNQFGTSQGIFLFFVIGFIFLLNILLLSLVNNRKFDY